MAARSTRTVPLTTNNRTVTIRVYLGKRRPVRECVEAYVAVSLASALGVCVHGGESGFLPNRWLHLVCGLTYRCFRAQTAVWGESVVWLLVITLLATR